MGIATTDRIAALLETLTLADLDAMKPAQREQLAQRLQHWGALANARGKPQKRKAGVLADLGNGQRGE
jgi:hypothetical protein